MGGVYVLRPDWLGWSSHGSTHMLKLIGLYLKHRFYYGIQNNIKIVNVKTHCLRKLPPPQLSPFDRVRSATTQCVQPDSWEAPGGLPLPAPASHSVGRLPGCRGVPGRPAASVSAARTPSGPRWAWNDLPGVPAVLGIPSRFRFSSTRNQMASLPCLKPCSGFPGT